MPDRGAGSAGSPVEVLAWCKLSAYQQSRHALRKLKRIEACMSREQIRKGCSLARRYYNRYVAGGIAE